MGEVGFAQYVPEVSKYVRSGRHFLNMNIHEYEIVSAGFRIFQIAEEIRSIDEVTCFAGTWHKESTS